MSQASRNTSGSCETRRRLIEAAGEVFAEHGFHNATIRQICERAGANVAAVNYHFRDKAELYDAVLRYSHCAAEAAYGPTRPPADAPPADRLRAFILSMLRRILNEGRPAWHGKLMSREMTEPTAALDGLVSDVFIGRFRELSMIVAELLGPHASQEEIVSCANSVIAQMVFYQHCKPLLERMKTAPAYDANGVEHLAEQVTRFSLCAMLELKRNLEAGSLTTASPHANETTQIAEQTLARNSV
jgi:AcrR family transcriptional regulator